MAKPGSDAARDLSRMARQAHDLGDRKIPEEVAEALCAAEEVRTGMRCAGCGERIGVGFRFTRVEALIHPKTHEPMAASMIVGACNGAAGCDFADEARSGASAAEMVEYLWLDGLGRPPRPEDATPQPEGDEPESMGGLSEEALRARHESAETDEELRTIRSEMIRRGFELPPTRDLPQAAPEERTHYSSRLCSTCRVSFPLPLADEEAWTAKDGALCCPDCSEANARMVAEGSPV